MKRKYILPFALLLLMQWGAAQELRLQKGQITDLIISNDSLNETFALYLPSNFDVKGTWPIVFVFEMEGKAKQALGMLKESAEKKGFILAAPNAIHDSISLGKNMAITQRVIHTAKRMLPINTSRIYTAGFENGGRFANLIPVFIKEVEGVISINAGLANIELLTSKNPFYFIGIVGKNDFNYTTILEDEKVLNKLKLKNSILLYEGIENKPSAYPLDKALDLLNLYAMRQGSVAIDSTLVEQQYKNEIAEIQLLQKEKKLLLADRSISETLSAYRTFVNTDSLKQAQRNLRKDRLFRNLKRSQSAAFLKEYLKREDYDYFLEEDILTYNYNNLGWWKHQTTQINAFIFGDSKVEQTMGKRLKSYLNALVEDNIALVKLDKVVDEAALVFLYMLKTITEPNDYNNYLEVVSISAKNDDYGTALFYLEEVLKKGFKDKQALYSIDHTTLLRITPEFNALVKKYLDDARYIIEVDE